MISEALNRLKTWFRETVAAAKIRLAAAAHDQIVSTGCMVRKLIAASDGNVLDTGKRYRKTSGHSPYFSLYTFFANR